MQENKLAQDTLQDNEIVEGKERFVVWEDNTGGETDFDCETCDCPAEVLAGFENDVMLYHCNACVLPLVGMTVDVYEAICDKGLLADVIADHECNSSNPTSYE